MAKQLLGRETLGVTPGCHIFKTRKSVGEKRDVTTWKQFILNSKIPESEFHYAGYNEDTGAWCLSSWIWTNAAPVRALIPDDLENALRIANGLLARQEDCGGWIVRNDYDKKGPIPVLAPNDSAYIANNAMLEVYLATNRREYLDSAERCARWIIDTAREDGIVLVGYNMRDKKWEKSCIIVDTGFTAALFARLYEITNDNKYRLFLDKFIARYIELFFIPSKNCFCTSINSKNEQQGGMFGRGQAWALEGLIAAFKVLKSDSIKEIIQRTIATLIKVQNNSGGWAYNLAAPLMGEDCKGSPVIAKSMVEWYRVSKDVKCLAAAQKALNWCRKHTLNEGPASGGIFSYTVEGGIVKDIYSSCAFVYASAYALEVKKLLDKLEHEQDNYSY